MGVVSSMATAISGLEANGQALGVISDNIVNANTTAFKSSRGEFQSILGAEGGGGEFGRGSSLAGVTTLYTQGPITKTDRGTDLAINGAGFFVLKGDNRGMSFTRDGSFRFDKEGWLTNLQGARVQAFQATPDGVLTQKLSDIRLPFASIPSEATKKIELNVNLDARMQVPPKGLDPDRPEETAQFTTAIQLFDSVGSAHAVSLYFTRGSDSTWNWNAMTDGGNLQGGTEGKLQSIATGALTFDTQGKLLKTEQKMENNNFANGALPDQKIQFDFGKSIEEGGTGQDGTTMYGTKSAMFRNLQNGWSAGYLTDTMIDGDGLVTGIYTNGQNRILGQIAVARFESNERLSKIGENQYRETTASGQPAIGKPNTNGRGVVMTRSLENSNVDLASEFVQMIKCQRGFQASAKSINTANEMLDEVIKLTRG